MLANVAQDSDFKMLRLYTDQRKVSWDVFYSLKTLNDGVQGRGGCEGDCGAIAGLM